MDDSKKLIDWFENDYLSRVGAYRKDCKNGCDVCMSLHQSDDYCDIDNLSKMCELLKSQQERIKVLEDEETAKNKPMKVVYDMNPMTRLPVSFCPICGYAVDRYAHGRNDLPQVFCPYCGQALDWKDGEQE